VHGFGVLNPKKSEGPDGAGLCGGAFQRSLRSDQRSVKEVGDRQSGKKRLNEGAREGFRMIRY